MILRLARELGKFPDEIVSHCSMENIVEWTAFLSLKDEDFPEQKKDADVENKLIKALGKPNG